MNPDSHSVVVRGQSSALEQEIIVGEHRLIADEPHEDGGANRGPSPHELLLSALGACTSMTVSMYAQRKNWPLREVTVVLRHSKPDPADGRPTDRIEREITFAGPLSPEQRSRLIEIANKCPVYRTLTSAVDIQTCEK